MIDITKKYRTRDGREVKLLMTDAGTRWTVIGAYRNADGTWWPMKWAADGSVGSRADDRDLVEDKPRIKREVWVNVTPDSQPVLGYAKREYADHMAHSDRAACVKITIDCEHGEGL
jgi:hypothetical protein